MNTIHTDDLLEKLDRVLNTHPLPVALHCGWCRKPLSGQEASLDFCRSSCQTNWHLARSEGYMDDTGLIDESESQRQDFIDALVSLGISPIRADLLARTVYVPAANHDESGQRFLTEAQVIQGATPFWRGRLWQVVRQIVEAPFRDPDR